MCVCDSAVNCRSGEIIKIYGSAHYDRWLDSSSAHNVDTYKAVTSIANTANRSSVPMHSINVKFSLNKFSLRKFGRPN